MKHLLLILIVTTMVSCSTSTNEENAYVLFNSIEFSVVNTAGEDLLDSNNPNSIDIDNIKLYHVIDNEVIEVYDSHLEHPRHFFVFEHENEYRIRVFQNTSENENRPITYIQWNETDTDTLQVEYDRTHNSLAQKKIWLNGEEIWNININDGPFLVLTK